MFQRPRDPRARFIFCFPVVKIVSYPLLETRQRRFEEDRRVFIPVFRHLNVGSSVGNLKVEVHRNACYFLFTVLIETRVTSSGRNCVSTNDTEYRLPGKNLEWPIDETWNRNCHWFSFSFFFSWLNSATVRTKVQWRE